MFSILSTEIWRHDYPSSPTVKQKLMFIFLMQQSLALDKIHLKIKIKKKEKELAASVF